MLVILLVLINPSSRVALMREGGNDEIRMSNDERMMNGQMMKQPLLALLDH